jgi:hypothetical protein
MCQSEEGLELERGDGDAHKELKCSSPVVDLAKDRRDDG